MPIGFGLLGSFLGALVVLAAILYEFSPEGRGRFTPEGRRPHSSSPPILSAFVLQIETTSCRLIPLPTRRSSMIEILPESKGKVVGVRTSGTLTDQGYT